MVGVILGTIFGIIFALLIGKWKGRGEELIAAVLAIPLFTYAISLPVLGISTQDAEVVASTFLGDFSFESLVSIQTFLAVIIAIFYAEIRSKQALSIDEFISISPLIWTLLASEIGLSAGVEKTMLILGAILSLILIRLSERDPFKSLNAKPCTGAFSELVEALGIKCFTDEESLMVALTEKALLVGGKTAREFPKLNELVYCLVRSKRTPNRIEKTMNYLLLFSPAVLVALVKPGPMAMFLAVAIAYSIYVIFAFNLVRKSRKNRPNFCEEVFNEYSQFIREKKSGRMRFVLG